MVVSSVPSKAITGLENDTSELLTSGMVTLGAKLSAVEDDRVVGRVVEVWSFFWDTVLPYVEGVCAFHSYTRMKFNSADAEYLFQTRLFFLCKRILYSLHYTARKHTSRHLYVSRHSFPFSLHIDVK